MMVRINNKSVDLPPNANLADALRVAGAVPPFAAALNMQFVPNSQYAQTPLRANDIIEIIRPVTGG